MNYAPTEIEFAARVAQYNREEKRCEQPYSIQPVPRDFMLAHLRAARMRAQLAMLEIDSIGAALKSDLIDTDQALEWLHDVDALRFLLPPEESTD